MCTRFAGNVRDPSAQPSSGQVRSYRAKSSGAQRESVGAVVPVMAVTKPGKLAALLRREGLYSSHLAAWRKARTKGGRSGLEPKQRGPKAKPNDPSMQEFAEQRI